MKDSPTQTVERDEDASPGEETMDLSWKGATPKVREEEEEEREEEEREEEEEEPSRQTDPEENDRDGSESGGPEAAESLVKTERVDDQDQSEDQRVDEHELDGRMMDSEDAGAEKEDDSVDYGEEDMFVDAQDSPINYAKYDSPTPPDGGALAGWNGSQRTAQGSSKLTCDICGLACVSLNVLLVHKRSHTGERPFHCQQCGASFTQKGNLLRHIKLHSGEKPFKCPMCSYACRRRDALSGHLRTHSVEKPYKCNHCGRSYKQRSSLEEHRERCHVYMQSKSDSERAGEEVSSNGGRAQGVERAILLDRLASNVAKRKSTMPQKFVGETPVCLDLCFKREPGVLQSGSDPLRSSSTPEGLHVLPSDAEQPPLHKSFPLQLSSGAPLALTNGGKLDRGAHQPGLLPPHHPAAPLDSPQHPRHHDGGPRPRHPSGLLHLQQQQQQQQQQHPSLPFSLSHLLVPGVSGAGGLPFPMHPHPPHLGPPHLVHQPPLPPHPHGVPPHEGLRVVQGKGEPGGAYMCSHCRVLFLDYVMFTIHMGCHGFRDPLECNLCGHLSRDRYEFSSHIARGEHYLEIK